MSNESRSRRPVWRATSAAATTPAAGPDSTAIAGMDMAGRLEDAAVRSHHVERRQRATARDLVEPLEIGRKNWPGIGAHCGRAGALELLDLGQHLRRQIDRDIRQRRPQPGTEPLLMRRVEEAEQERDRDG